MGHSMTRDKGGKDTYIELCAIDLGQKSGEHVFNGCWVVESACVLRDIAHAPGELTGDALRE